MLAPPAVWNDPLVENRMPPTIPRPYPPKTRRKTPPLTTNPVAPASALIRSDVPSREPRLRVAAAFPKPTGRRSTAFGWFRVGLGLTQLLAPQAVARWAGIDDEHDSTRLTLRLIGARQVACGLGLLSQSRSVAWASAGVAGGIVDAVLLGTALQSRGAHTKRLLGAGAAVLGVACVDAYAAYGAQRQARDVDLEGIEVRESVTIARPPEAVYALLRDFKNLPQFMSHVQSVRVDNGHSHWSVKGPLGSSIEWDAEIVEERENALIVWRSTAGADVAHQGRVELRALGDRDTELGIVLRYDPPLGKVGAAIAESLGVAPGQQISSDLRRLKQILETGEVLHSDASIHRGMHPARPSELSARINEEMGS
jgi:uncharacterized membrane protein